MVIGFKDLEKIRKKFANKKIVFTAGSFDILHLGHVKFINKSKKYGEILVVGVSSDKRIRERKGIGRPIISEKDRVGMVDSIKGVDYSVIMPFGFKHGFPPTTRIIDKLKPDYFVTADLRWLEYEKDIKPFGTKLIIVEVSPNKIRSTSSIIRKVINKNIFPAV